MGLTLPPVLCQGFSARVGLGQPRQGSGRTQPVSGVPYVLLFTWLITGSMHVLEDFQEAPFLLAKLAPTSRT